MALKNLSPCEAEIAQGGRERIRLGTGTDFFAAFLKYSHRLGISSDAECMLDHVELRAPVPIAVEVVRRSVYDLGLDSGGYFKSIMARVTHRRQECPPELGPQFCLQHLDWRKGEKLYIAMKPIVVSGCPCIFSVREDHGLLWLTTDAADDRSYFSADSTFLLTAPRTQ